MEIWINFGWLALGLSLLYFGAEWLVRGSSEIALRLGLSPLIVGLTVVAFGTSAPELLVSMQANLANPPQGDMALGNIVGSNICNIALILGVGAVIRPIVVHLQVIRREMPILLVISVVFVFMLGDGVISRWEGAVLTLGIVVYVVASIRMAKRETNTAKLDEINEHQLAMVARGGVGRIAIDVGLILVGLAALVYGANRMVESGLALAGIFSVPEAIIALTLVAFGTSLPELATSVVASLRNQGDIITGNAIGSCIFNVLAVVGITSVVAPINSLGLDRIDLWVMLGLTVLIIPILATGRRLSRVEGCLLLVGYVGYCLHLVGRA